LAALAGLAARPWRLLVAGVRAPRTWERRAERLRLAGRVRFQPEADMRALLAAADLTALPTWRDTSSLVALESLASGTPVITSARCGEAGLVVDGRTGSVVADPADVDGLRARLAEWIERSVRGAAADPRAVREAVEDRGAPAWL